MNKNTLTVAALSSLILAGATVGTVSAQTVAVETGLTEDQAVAIAQLEVPGEVQDIELENEDGVQVYEIEILAEDGTEMEVEINADTGEVLEVGEDGKDCDGDKRKGKDRGDRGEADQTEADEDSDEDDA